MTRVVVAALVWGAFVSLVLHDLDFAVADWRYWALALGGFGPWALGRASAEPDRDDTHTMGHDGSMRA